MPPIVNPAATIPYEIASDIEYAERRLASFDKWAFNDPNRALMSVINAVDTYGRVWGRLAGRQGFSLERHRPYAVHIGLWARESLPEDAVVAKAIEVASAVAAIESNPLVYHKGMDRELLRRELARKDDLVRRVNALGDLVRDRVQEDYIRLQPGDWVRVPFWQAVGRVAAIEHARVRVTTAEGLSRFHPTQSGSPDLNHRYSSWDLIRHTVEKIPAPNPLPLCVPGLEWFTMAHEAQRSFDFYFECKSSNFLELRSKMKLLGFAIEMLFRSEQPCDTLRSTISGRHTFPQEHSAIFPGWIVDRLRAHYALAGEFDDLTRKINPPPWIQMLPILTALKELGGEMIDLLADHIAHEVGKSPGAKLQVFGNYILPVPDYDLEEGFGPVARTAILIKQNGRTLSVEFAPDEDLPGLHEVDITDIRA